MDKLAKYRHLTKQLLSKYAEVINRSANPNQEIEVVIDEERDHYLLLTMGWRQKRRVKGNTVHIRLKGNKFWVEEDGLEHGIATDLLEAGVPNEDIVLAFHHPNMRPYTEFAVS